MKDYLYSRSAIAWLVAGVALLSWRHSGPGPGALPAVPRPSPRLAADIAAVFPALAITWELLRPAVVPPTAMASDRRSIPVTVESRA